MKKESAGSINVSDIKKKVKVFGSTEKRIEYLERIRNRIDRDKYQHVGDSAEVVGEYEGSSVYGKKKDYRLVSYDTQRAINEALAGEYASLAERHPEDYTLNMRAAEATKKAAYIGRTPINLPNQQLADVMDPVVLNRALKYAEKASKVASDAPDYSRASLEDNGGRGILKSKVYKNVRSEKEQADSLVRVLKDDMSREPRNMRFGGLENSATGAVSVIALVSGAFFFSTSVTGNVIGLSNGTSSIIGAVLLVIGFVAGYFWAKGRKARKKK